MDATRLVVAGMVGAGKSTLVETLSAGKSVQTDRPATDGTAQIKATTTVAMDYCTLQLPNQPRMHIYGVPGQERFDFMWDIVIGNADVCLVLVAAHRPELLTATQRFIRTLRSRAQAATAPPRLEIAVGITHSDMPGALTTSEIAVALRWQDIPARPPLQIDPRQPASIHQALIKIFTDPLQT